MSADHSPLNSRHKKNKLAFLAGTSIVFFLLLSCSFSNPFALFKPTPTDTPTRTHTPSPTNTSTPTSSATNTDTPTFTPLPPRFELQTRTDGGTLVMDLPCGYQFILPSNWRVATTFSEVSSLRTYQSVAEAPRNNGDWVNPNLHLYIRSFSKEMATLELELGHYTADRLGPMEKVLSQLLTTNQFGTALGTLKLREMKTSEFIPDGSNKVVFIPGSMKNKNDSKPLVGPSYFETYEVLFYCEDQVINFKFSGITSKSDSFTSQDMQLMYTVQNSIQFK